MQKCLLPTFFNAHEHYLIHLVEEIELCGPVHWMTVWIERCQHSGRTLTWEGVSSLVKEAHRNGDSNVTQREIDLACGLRDFQVRTNLLITRMFINS